MFSSENESQINSYSKKMQKNHNALYLQIKKYIFTLFNL